MKQKLENFESFAQSILPHEMDYLLDNNQINDPERLQILQYISEVAHDKANSLTLNTHIDKRKYSHLKKWIQEKFDNIDVDLYHNWLNTLDQKILQDSIDHLEERKLLKLLKEYDHCHFFFTKLYEVLLNYSHFLLVRLRLSDYSQVMKFLSEYEYAYKSNKLVEETLHKASNEIVTDYMSGNSNASKWRSWLIDSVYSSQIQGHLRYHALTRLHFCALTDGDYDGLMEHYDYIDGFFAKGSFYSKRILMNYYFNRMLLHAKFKDYRRANYFGLLSIKVKTHDFLLYTNNLSHVLMDQGLYQKALDLLKSANEEYKKSNNFYHKTDYVSLFMTCLMGLKNTQSAENFGNSFYKAYRTEIFESRWYTFFSVYLKCLIEQKKYAIANRIISSEKLLIKIKSLPKNALYQSKIEFYAHEISKMI